MVDVRPLIFANALFLMLLITAGFAHVRDQSIMSGAVLPDVSVSPSNTGPVNEIRAESGQAGIQAASTDNSEPGQSPDSDTPDDTKLTEPSPLALADDEIFANVPSQNKDSLATARARETIAVADPKPAAVPEAKVKPAIKAVDHSTPAKSTPRSVDQVAAIATVTAAPVTPKTAARKQVPAPALMTGKLVVRSNVEGDTVLIDGKPYGPTRLEVDLTPGSYTVEVAKNGYTSWKTDVSVRRGANQTLIARLDHYTTVDYRNGEWINGVTTGEGTYLADDGTRYQGAFVNGKFHGKGDIRYPDGTEYRGEWFEGGMQGDGTLITNQGDTFIGTFKDGEFNGEGTLTKANGDIYTGYWVNGALNGQGSLTTKDGLLFVGGFSDNQFHGEGSLTYPDGRYYEGSFSKGQFHGKGTEIYANGKKYTGQFMEGQYHGKGELMNPNGSKITGTFKFGQPFGKATLTTPEGEIFTARTTEPGVCYRLKSYRATQCPPMEGW